MAELLAGSGGRQAAQGSQTLAPDTAQEDMDGLGQGEVSGVWRGVRGCLCLVCGEE